jgi:erythronate-4-phosphate dehydrogenase
LKLVIDENIAFASEAFSRFGELLLVNGREINNKILSDADVLIVRSVTNIDEQLLKSTKVKFVGTATIGTEHIDTNFLKENSISFADAKGCNADSVTEYVFTALLNVAVKKKISLHNKTIGVIGIGNIGSRVVRYAEALGLKVLKNDPPKERAGIGSNYVSLDEALSADIVTLHVPMNKSGINKTFHLLDRSSLGKIKKGAILINTSRGAVIDNKALLKIMSNKQLNVILDVWEGEPLINSDLLERVDIGTAHIAGYSLEGKVNGTKMIYDALCNFTGHQPDWEPELPAVEDSEITLPAQGSIEERLHFVFNKIYNIESDNKRIKKIINMDTETGEKYFAELRKVYPLRREFDSYTVTINIYEKEFVELLKRFRFNAKVVD